MKTLKTFRAGLLVMAFSLVISNQVFAEDGASYDQGFSYTHSPTSGFFVLADARFEPWVQRMMAERSLKSLPLSDGRLYYVYPVNIDPQIEEFQIRYMEELLEKTAQREELADEQKSEE